MHCHSWAQSSALSPAQEPIEVPCRDDDDDDDDEDQEEAEWVDAASLRVGARGWCAAGIDIGEGGEEGVVVWCEGGAMVMRSSS
jgi:hypothetical protein